MSRKVYFKIPDEDKNTLFEETDTKIWLIANYTIIFFIILSIILVWIDSLPNITQNQKFTIFILDFIISTVFFIEYIYRFINSDEKKIFPFRFINMMDLLSFLPFFILIIFYWIWTYWFFSIFRIFRIFRIFELLEKVPIAKKVIKWIFKHHVEYLAAIFVIIIILTIASTWVYYSEHIFWDKEIFISLPQTFWWAIVTMTTTWYWDMVPTSLIWKIIASIIMFLWPILVTILSSITVIIFLESTKIIELEEKTDTCNNCWKRNPNNSIYCNRCWKKININRAQD